MNEFEQVKNEFGSRIYQYIQEVFSKSALEIDSKVKKEKEESNIIWVTDTTMNGIIYSQLTPYQPLIHWFKRREDKHKFDKLLQVRTYLFTTLFFFTFKIGI